MRRRKCSMCKKKNARRGQFTCKPCHAAYMKQVDTCKRYKPPAPGRPDGDVQHVACTRHPESHATLETRSYVDRIQSGYVKTVRRRRLCRRCGLRWTNTVVTGATEAEYKASQVRRQRRRGWERAA
jgi:hypothetical protein